LTAPFGSGCTTAAGILEERHGFRAVKLSACLTGEWERRNPGRKPQRRELQRLGNELRKSSGERGLLASRAIQELESAAESFDRIVLDGIRNVGEIEYLRSKIGNGLFVFALDCPASQRWERLRPIYEREQFSIKDFHTDDKHDLDEDDSNGQQVQLCVDEADVLISNRDEGGLAALRDKLSEYVGLVSSEQLRFARPIEIFMNLAYSASHGSKCLKRQVGALIVSAKPGEMGEIVGQGFNENPWPTSPCVEETLYGYDPAKKQLGKCYRDIVRAESLQTLIKERSRCPACGTQLTTPVDGEASWRCAKCKSSMLDSFWPERAMTFCTAVHAEVAALLAAGRRARGATLYTTTLPCFQCSEKIIQAGVKCIVFNEPYPDIRAAERLRLGRVEVEVFEGIRSRRFDEIFSKIRKSL
jgi:deoxycytidylate deaminase